MPARTRSTIKDRSNSAIAEIMVNMALPMGEDVSICSVIEMKSTPSERNSSRASMSCLVERAKRSNFQTKTVVEDLTLNGQTSTLVVIEQDSTLAEVFSQHLILSQQILDRVLLVSVDPTGQDEQQELPGLEHEVHG